MIGAILNKFISPFMPYILGGAVVAMIVLSGLYYWKSSQYDKLAVDSAANIERAEHNAVQLNQAVLAQEKTISGLLEEQERR